MSRAKLRNASVEALLKRARAGDQAALDELFNRCRPMLRVWAAKEMGASQHGAAGSSDVAQTSAQHAFESFPKFEGETEGEWNAWLWRILVTCLGELIRSAGRQKRDERRTIPLTGSEVDNIPDPETSPSQVAAHREEYARLLTNLSELPPDQRLAVWYCCFKKYTDVEAAKKMHKTPAAIRGLLRRGIDALQALLVGGSTGSSEDDSEEIGQKSAISSALLSYIRRALSSEDVDREAFLAAHAAYADELRPRLDAVDLIFAMWDDPPDSE